MDSFGADPDMIIPLAFCRILRNIIPELPPAPFSFGINVPGEIVEKPSALLLVLEGLKDLFNGKQLDGAYKCRLCGLMIPDAEELFNLKSRRFDYNINFQRRAPLRQEQLKN